MTELVGVEMLSELLQISDPMIAKSVLRSHLGIRTEPTIKIDPHQFHAQKTGAFASSVKTKKY